MRSARGVQRDKRISRSFVNSGLHTFPHLVKSSQVEILKIGNNPIVSFKGMVSLEQLKMLNCDNTLIESFADACPLPSLTNLSFVNTPISRYPLVRVMSIVVFGNSLEIVDHIAVKKLERNKGNHLRDTLYPFLTTGWILTAIQPIKIYHYRTKARRVIFKTESPLKSHLPNFTTPPRKPQRSPKSKASPINATPTKKIVSPSQIAPTEEVKIEQEEKPIQELEPEPEIIEINKKEEEEEINEIQPIPTEEEEKSEIIAPIEEAPSENMKEQEIFEEKKELEEEEKTEPVAFLETLQPLPKIPLIPESSLPLEQLLQSILLSYSQTYDLNEVQKIFNFDNPEDILVTVRVCLLAANIRPLHIRQNVSFIKEISKGVDGNSISNLFVQEILVYPFYSHTILAILIDVLLKEKIIIPKDLSPLMKRLVDGFQSWDYTFSLIVSEDVPSLEYTQLLILFSPIIKIADQQLYESLRQQLKSESKESELKQFEEFSYDNHYKVQDIFLHDDVDAIESVKDDEQLLSNSILELSQWLDDSCVLLSCAAFSGASKIFNKIYGGETDDILMFCAAAGGNSEIISVLKENGVDFGETIEAAIQYHNNDLFKENVQEENSEYLNIALTSSNYEVMKSIKKMPDPFDAIENRNAEMFHFISNYDEFNPNQISQNSITLLHSATLCDVPLIVRLLLCNQKIKINLKDNKSWTPLHCAANLNLASICLILLQSPDIDVNATDKNQLFTPLHIAVTKGYLDVVNLLIRHPNIDVNQCDRDKWSPLLFACADNQLTEGKNQEEIVKLLVSKEGINGNSQSIDGWAPLHLAVASEYTNIVRYLITIENINLNVRSNDGSTPLIIAVQKNNKEIVDLLLKFGGVDANLKNDMDIDALSAAKANNNTEIADMIAKYMQI